MSEIEFKTKISYYQFQDLEKTLMVLDLNNIEYHTPENDHTIELVDNENGDYIGFSKGDYIFFYSYAIVMLSTYDFALLSAENAKKVIKHLEENQVSQLNCPLSISGNCKALE